MKVHQKNANTVHFYHLVGVDKTTLVLSRDGSINNQNMAVVETTNQNQNMLLPWQRTICQTDIRVSDILVSPLVNIYLPLLLPAMLPHVLGKPLSLEFSISQLTLQMDFHLSTCTLLTFSVSISLFRCDTQCSQNVHWEREMEGQSESCLQVV